MNNRIQILDCTLRDGGLGLEDAFKNKIADIGFTDKDKKSITNNLKKSKVDIIELGSIEISEEDKTKFAIYQNVKGVSCMIPSDRMDDQMFVGLFRGPDTPLEDIPERKNSFVDGLRVIIRYSELKKSIEFCAGLSKKGYKVFVQPMLTMRYTDEEIHYMIDEANKMNAYALYFVDSYGYMDEEDIKRLFYIYNEGLNKNIRIGFHAHNNMNLAFSNSRYFIKYAEETKRNIIVDSCVTGMGQGAGNLQTELIVPYLCERKQHSYDFNAILEVCEVLDGYLTQGIWGYSVTRLLPAIHHTAYKYAISLRNKYGLSYALINKILATIPEELRHRYTEENTMLLLEKNGIEFQK